MLQLCYPESELKMELQKLKQSGYGFFMLTFFFMMQFTVEAASLDCPTSSPCYGKTKSCPKECATNQRENPRTRICWVNCYSPLCQPECRSPDPNCNAPGSVCLDPRFIGGDGIVFYFHGKGGEHFTLLTDKNLQINSRFIGHRPEGRHRDFTWIQALGFLFGTDDSFSLEADKAATWNPETDYLRLSYKGQELPIPERLLSVWESPSGSVRVQRNSGKNSVTVTIPSVADILVSVVPVTKEDDRIHKYRVPSDNCFAHLAVQFRFFALSPEVEGVLGRTYRPDFENPAKPGVAMAVVGGEDMYRTTSLLKSDCQRCDVFSAHQSARDQLDAVAVEHGTLECSSAAASGGGIVCRR